ncbi:hypothetical protein THARTR1_00598 [Trichoderma harzianum]|uniref:WSC domain-containing protein n=1 Tax=Trichoderma harzianum TaxID=5544 RepID=A0A2K0UPL5_TRIHA|nr:hypothetical protein THARTR1_00598 [Trichoderma harzianum]
MEPPTTTSQPTQKPTPTIVQTSGNFKYQGCFEDLTDDRTLVVDQQTDATGMTLEKCIKLAQSQGVRFAGVEFGRECFVGNTIHTSTKFPDSDCNQVCTGNDEETCGSGNRIQIYLDTTWSDPTLDELTQVLLQYNSSLFQLQQFTSQYQSLISQWDAEQKSTQKKRGGILSNFWQKRSLTVTQLEQGLSQIEQQYPFRSLNEMSLAQAAQNGGVLYLRAARSDLSRPGQANPFVDPPTLNDAQQAFDIPLEPLTRVQSNIEDDLQTISDAGSSTPLLNTARDLGDAASAVEATGIIVAGSTLSEIAAAGAGVSAVFLFLHPPSSGDGDGGGVSHTVSLPTSTTTSMQSSETQYLIVANKGVSATDFKAFTDTLPKNKNDADLSESNGISVAHLATLNDSMVNQVGANSLVNAIVVNDHHVADPPTSKRSISRDSSRSTGRQRDSFNKRTLPGGQLSVKADNIVGQTSLLFRDATNLAHLKLLSSKWFDDSTINEGGNFDGNGYLYESTQGEGVTIIVVDSGVNLDHVEFQNVQRTQLFSKFLDVSKADVYHGTAVASCALGANIGVSPKANLVSVAIDMSTEASIYDGIELAFKFVKDNNLQGKSVMNWSFGNRFESGVTRVGDWYQQAIKAFNDIGVVVVAAAGNFGNNDDDIEVTDERDLFSDIRPASYSTSFPGLISVGAVDDEGFRASFSPKCDLADSTATCVTAYAMGDRVMLANIRSGTSGYHADDGTSFAAPIISGLAAYLISHPSPKVQTFINQNGQAGKAAQISQLIQQWSFRRPATNIEGLRPDTPNAPLVAWNGALLNECRINTLPPLLGASDDPNASDNSKRSPVVKRQQPPPSSGINVVTATVCSVVSATATASSA